MSINRRKLVSASVLAAGTVLSAPAIAQSPPIVRWRLASSFPKSLDTIYGAMTTLAREVAALTEGKFEIQVFAAGELVPGLQVLDAVSNGTVEAGHTAGFYYFGKSPSLIFDTGVPFGLTPRQHAAWWNFGNGRQLMEKAYSKFGVVPIPAGNTGAQMGGWFRKELKTLDDLRGLKMRVAGFSGKIMAKLGVVPQQIPGGDIYPALERGTIDAVEWIGPYDDEKLGFQKIAKFYYGPGIMEPGASIPLIINSVNLNNLPASYQAALRAACRVAEVEMLASYDAKNAKAVRSLVGAGANLKFFSNEIMEALRRATNETLAEEAASNEEFRAIYNDWKTFRDEQHTWFNINDALAERFIYAR
jgi:TRAP-type mannitol/chloroaromatic compound transport system substrate-binding protein